MDKRKLAKANALMAEMDAIQKTLDELKDADDKTVPPFEYRLIIGGHSFTMVNDYGKKTLAYLTDDCNTRLAKAKAEFEKL